MRTLLKHGSLKRIQTAINSYRLVKIADLTSMNTKHGYRVGKGFIVGRNEPPIPKAA